MFQVEGAVERLDLDHRYPELDCWTWSKSRVDEHNARSPIFLKKVQKGSSNTIEWSPVERPSLVQHDLNLGDAAANVPITTKKTSTPKTNTSHQSTMILRHSCLRQLRTLHTSSRLFAAVAKASPAAVTNASPLAPFPPKSRPADNDPTYTHPPSSVKAGSPLKNLQLLKDKGDIVALPDDFYPDWLWQLLDEPQSVVDREQAKREIEKKKEIYVAQLNEERTQKQLIESKKSRVVKPGEKRTLEEKRAVRREAQNEAWLVNREKEYDVPQYEMPPERNVKFHKKINRENIKQENYLRARGMK